VADSEALARAILDVLEHSPGKASLRARAQHFSVDAAVDAYLEVFGSLRPEPPGESAGNDTQAGAESK